MPTKDEILRHARRIELEDIVGKGLPALTPEDYELKESGAFHKARRQLMSGHTGEMERYVRDMAGEIGLVVYAKNYVKKLQETQKRREEWEDLQWKHKKRLKETIFEREKLRKLWLGALEEKKKSNGNSVLYLAHAMKLRSPFIQPVPKIRKQRKKRHVQRTAKTMRRLRKRVKDGQKVFSFPDHIWKVR